jgi:hypothetical protein
MFGSTLRALAKVRVGLLPISIGAVATATYVQTMIEKERRLADMRTAAFYDTLEDVLEEAVNLKHFTSSVTATQKVHDPYRCTIGRHDL